MADSIRSPQADILDRLIWSRLSSFWTKDYDPSDKEALNAIYEGALAALDAEYVRLYEINQAKAISTAPVHSQRRWMRLDLNRHADLAAFLKFLQADSTTGTVSSDGSTLNCIASNNHPRHWHIQFPFIVPAGDPLTRSTLDLTYPTEDSLVTIHRIALDPTTGKRSGIRLKPDLDYSVLDNKSSIRINGASPGEEYEFNVAFDYSKPEWDGLKPVVAYASGADRISDNIIQVPTSLQQANLAIHAMVVRNVVDNGTGGLQDSNNVAFGTTYQFIPWTGTTSGPLHGAVAGQVVLPTSIVLGSNDAVFVFGIIRGEWNLAHRHTLATTFLNPSAIPGQSGAPKAAGSTSVVEFTTLIKPGVFGSLGYLGQTLEVYLDGKLLDRSEYDLTSDNELLLKTPVVWDVNQFVAIDVRFSDEYTTIQQVLGDQHVHYVCLIAEANPPQTFSTFDDGGDLDDGGNIDDATSVNVLFISDVLASIDTLEVFINGVYANRGIDYSASKDPDTGRVRLSFVESISGKSVLVSYRREVRTYIYGDFATSSFGNGITGGNRETLSGLLSDVQGLIASFGATYKFDSQNVGRLVEAAQVAAQGGNPLLTLFFDEFEEYDGLPVDAAGMPITAQDARNLESTNTQLISIPFLTDHVLNPTVRLREGQDYDVLNGNLLSSVDLTTPRGPDDTQPGVWWCPVVILDEQFLAKNFGSLIGVTRASDEALRQALQANFELRFSGPVVKNVEWDMAIMLGSPAFQQDGKVVSIVQQLVGYEVTVGNDVTQEVKFVPAPRIPLSVGSAVVPTQSLTEPPIYEGAMPFLRSSSGSQIVLDQAFPRAKVGDIVRLTLMNPDDLAHTAITFASQILSISVSVDYMLPRTTIVLRDAPRFAPTVDSHLVILHQAGAPFASINGTVQSVSKVQQYLLTTTQEAFTLPVGATPEYRVGDSVFRGQPLFPSYATVYDDIRRKDWYLLTPEQFRASWDFASRGLGQNVQFAPATDNRLAAVAVPADPTKYSEMTLDPPTPTVPRGSTVLFTDAATSDVIKFTVVGGDGINILVTPVVSAAKTGTVVVTPPTSATARLYFEGPNPPSGSPIETALAFPQVVRSRSIQVVSTAAFPSAGRVAVRLPNGGSTEFTYNNKAASFFLECEWPSDFPALTARRTSPTVPGLLEPMIPGTAVLRLVSPFTSTRINPAFAALVNERVSANDQPVPVTDSNAAELYELLKTNASVLESHMTSRPSDVSDAIVDLTPAGSTLVFIAKQIVVDTYHNEATDRHLEVNTIIPYRITDDGAIRALDNGDRRIVE